MSVGRKRKDLNRLRILILLLLVAIGLVLAILQLTNVIHVFNNPAAKINVIKTAGTTTPSPKSDVSSSIPPSGTSSSNGSNNLSQGAFKDTTGTAATTTSPSQWIVSQSGNITVKQPIVNSTLQSGAVISGSANVSQVNFRLIDNQVGVIDQGMLNVSSGNFSGILYFQSHAASGRLDIFSTEPNGAEINEIQISVNF